MLKLDRFVISMESFFRLSASEFPFLLAPAGESGNMGHVGPPPSSHFHLLFEFLSNTLTKPTS